MCMFRSAGAAAAAAFYWFFEIHLIKRNVYIQLGTKISWEFSPSPMRSWSFMTKFISSRCCWMCCASTKENCRLGTTPPSNWQLFNFTWKLEKSFPCLFSVNAFCKWKIDSSLSRNGLFQILIHKLIMDDCYHSSWKWFSSHPPSLPQKPLSAPIILMPSHNLLERLLNSNNHAWIDR